MSKSIACIMVAFMLLCVCVCTCVCVYLYIQTNLYYYIVSGESSGQLAHCLDKLLTGYILKYACKVEGTFSFYYNTTC